MAGFTELAELVADAFGAATLAVALAETAVAETEALAAGVADALAELTGTEVVTVAETEAAGADAEGAETAGAEGEGVTLTDLPGSQATIATTEQTNNTHVLNEFIILISLIKYLLYLSKRL